MLRLRYSLVFTCFSFFISIELVTKRNRYICVSICLMFHMIDIGSLLLFQAWSISRSTAVSINTQVIIYCRFHCHTIIKTIKQIKSRMKEIKKDEHSNSLTKVEACAMFRAGDIRRNVLLKFIRLCMETPCLCPSQGHKYGGRKLKKTYVIEFCYKKPVVVF